MKTWRVEVTPGVEERLTAILEYISRDPLHNPDAALSVYLDFESTVRQIGLMGDRIPVGSHPIMRERQLRRINFERHRYYLIYRLNGEAAQVVRIGHFLEDADGVLR